MTPAEFGAAVWATCEQPLAERDWSLTFYRDDLVITVDLTVCHGGQRLLGCTAITVTELRYARDATDLVLRRVRDMLLQIDAARDAQP